MKLATQLLLFGMSLISFAAFVGNKDEERKDIYLLATLVYISLILVLELLWP